MFAGSSSGERRRSAISRALPYAGPLFAVLTGCEHQDRIVGSNRAPTVDASGPAVADAASGARAAPLISTDFAADEGLWDRQRLIPGSTVSFGVQDPLARDGFELVLRLPGIAGLGASDYVGPDLSTEVETKQFVKFGSLRAKVRFPSCDPGEEVVSAAFAFFNDGSDRNGNGLPDNPELDFQVLCGRPSFIVLTAWSDFELMNDGSTRFLKTSRAVDTATGDIYELPSAGGATYARTGNDAAYVHAGFPDPDTFYEVGFDWSPALVRFFAVLGNKELTLFTVTDRAYVPSVPLQIMFNLWHPATHWVPDRTTAAYPARDADLHVDFMEFGSQ
jgi:hypothetical protein